MLALPAAVPAASAQNIEGQIIAAQYGTWRVPGYAPDTYSFAPTACRVQGGASYFQAFTAGVPVKIVDGNPTMSEVVVPTAVEEDNSQCRITIHPTHRHQPPFYLTSATGGLQEAINANLANPGPNTILLNNAWYELGGSAQIIASVHGSTNLGLVDVTQVPAKWYQWDGSQYVPVNPPGGGSANTLVNDLVSNSSSGNFQDLYHFYATGPDYSIQNAVNAAAAHNGTVTIQPSAGHQPFTPPAGTADYGFDDKRLDVPAKPESFKKFGAQCDGVVATGAFTPGSNQLAGVSYSYMGSGGYLTPLSDYGDGTAVVAIGWKDSNGAQWVWEPTITSINGTTATLSGNAPADIPTGTVSFVMGHDDTAAFTALSNYLPLAEIEFPSSIYKGCLTHAVTLRHNAGAVLWKGQWTSTIMGFPGEDVFEIAPGSNISVKMQGLHIEANDQVDARQGYTLIKADGSQQVFPPMWEDGGLKRFWGQGTPWANNPTMAGWIGQTLSSAQTSTDTTIPVSDPLVNLSGDKGYNGTAPYGCVKIQDQGDANSEIECYENYTENDSGPTPIRTLNHAQRGMFQSLGFSAPTAHASGANVVPVDPVSPLTPFITAGTAYNFKNITLERSGNVVTVTLPIATTVFGVSDAEIEIVGSGTGDFAGTFAVASASGDTVTYDQTGNNEGPVSAGGYAALAGTMRPVVWPAFAAGNAALASDSPDGLTSQSITLTYSSFASDSFDVYMTTNNDHKGSGGVWMQGGMYRDLWDDIQIHGTFGFLSPPPFVNTNVLGAFDSETNTFTRFDVHSGRGFVLSGEADSYVKGLNDYSEEDTYPGTSVQFPGIGPSLIPSVNDQTGEVSSGSYANSWNQIYSEPAQYTTEMKSGVYEAYYMSYSEFGPGVAHSINAGATLIQGNANIFNGPYWNIFPIVGPSIFLKGDDNHGWINASSTINSIGPALDQWNPVVMDEGSNNQCWVTNGTATISACRGVALSGGSTGDWAKRGVTDIHGVYGSDSDLILTPQELLHTQVGGPSQWGAGSFQGFDINAPHTFTYAAQPASAFANGNIRPYSFSVSTVIGQNYPAVHGTLYIMAKASAATNETYHAYYYGNSLTCGNENPQYIDQGGSAGIALSLTTSWQIFSFGVNLENAPIAGCVFAIGDDAPATAGAEIDTAWIQFVPDGQYQDSSLFATTVGPALASAATVQLTTGLEHITGTATITTLTPPRTYFTGCVSLIPDGAWQTATGGNIALASTAVVGKVLRECYDGNKWYPSY